MIWKRRYTLILIGALLGASAGYAYWYFWGCTEGCAITSSPWRSAVYGMLMGGLALDLNHKKEEKP